MTVHGSKGLQAPIVILPDTVRVVGTKKEGGLLWDDIFYYPLTAGDYEKNCAEIKNREAELALEEYRRLLYVALTRAEDRLCICGYRKKTKPRTNPGMNFAVVVLPASAKKRATERWFMRRHSS